MNSEEFSEELIASLDDVEEAGMRDGINGVPGGGLKPPKATPTGDSVPSGPTPKSSGAPMPKAPGAPGAMPPASGASSAGGLAPKSPGGEIPTSQFAKNQEVPEIKIDPLKHPDDHEHDEKCAAEGSHVVTAEFCLEQLSRVLMELAEQQEDPAWVEAHRTLAEQWMQTAQMLLQFRIDAQANAGEIELKQQQLQQQHEMHQQTLAQGDQLHSQTMQQNDDMHKQGMTQKDEQHKVGLDQQDQQHKFKMDSAGKHEKLKLDTAAQQSKMTLQAKKQQMTAKPSSPAKKPTP